MKQEATRSPGNDVEMQNLVPKHTKSPLRSIESPKYNLGLSPIHRFLNANSPTGSPLLPPGGDERKGLNIDTQT